MASYGLGGPGIAAVATGWLLALGALIGTVAVVPRMGRDRTARHVITAWRARAAMPQPLLEQRYHGSLDVITDSERRSLRPIAATAYDVAVLTGELLADLLVIPGVRIFRGVRAAGTALPLIPHAVSAGRQLVLIESVSWPPGCYETAADGHVHCDGTYIGQSARPLTATVRHWRESLPKSHHVSAVVVVHAAAEGQVTLPAATPGDLAWVRAEDAVRDVRQRILCGRQDTSRDLVAALVAAIAGEAD
jgi:hypothetical protein